MKKLVGALCLVGGVVAGIVRMASTEVDRGGERPSALGTSPDRVRPRAAELVAAEALPRVELPASAGPAPARVRVRVVPLAGSLADDAAGAELVWTPLLSELEGVRYVH